jgi:hypothetical protein
MRSEYELRKMLAHLDEMRQYERCRISEPSLCFAALAGQIGLIEWVLEEETSLIARILEGWGIGE